MIRTKVTVTKLLQSQDHPEGRTVFCSTPFILKTYKDAADERPVDETPETPIDEMMFMADNPVLIEQFQLGKEFYVDISPVEE